MSKYLLRLDDASDYMDVEKWQRMENLLDKYGIKPFGIFGSFAWNQQDEASDLDVFVTLQKSDFLLWKR